MTRPLTIRTAHQRVQTINDLWARFRALPDRSYRTAEYTELVAAIRAHVAALDVALQEPAR
jgi:hypothetical protein